MSDRHPRIAREEKTVRAMLQMYCHDLHHASDGLCPACEELLDYAGKRLSQCPYQGGKTSCAMCPTHCYKPTMREQIRMVMRYAGPQMMYRHPILALYHLFDGRRKEPIKPVSSNEKASRDYT